MVILSTFSPTHPSDRFSTLVTEESAATKLVIPEYVAVVPSPPWHGGKFKSA